MTGKEIWVVFRKMREGLGIPQTVLANKVGMSDSKLSRWENGQGDLSSEEMDRIGDVLDVALSERVAATSGPLASSEREAVKLLRKLYGIGQIELARKAELSQATISLYENGHIELDAEQLEAVEHAIETLIAMRSKRLPVPLSTLAGKPSAITPREARKDQQIDLLWQIIGSLRREIVSLEEQLEAQKQSQPEQTGE
jgi:transcriptional regulator with XRE-family HTH domain